MLWRPARRWNSGEADLAIVRSDTVDPAIARTVVQIGSLVVVVAAAPGSSISTFKDIKGKSLGVLAADVNRPLLDVIFKSYGLTFNDVRVVDLAPAEITQAYQSGRVSSVLLAVTPTEKAIANFRSVVLRNAKSKPNFIPIDVAEKIADDTRIYESYELPQGSIRAEPPAPADDISTLKVPVYLVANKKLGDDVVEVLTRQIMDARGALVRDSPALAQLKAPETSKDALIPIHPGAESYFEGTGKTFFDKYGDYLFYGPMLFAALASVIGATLKFLQPGERATAALVMERIDELTRSLREAKSPEDVEKIEDEVGQLLRQILFGKYSSELVETDTAVLSLAIHRLDYLIDGRRRSVERL